MVVLARNGAGNAAAAPEAADSVAAESAAAR
jgi:hypothetical protein